jgi:SAM-dependent methyltransferase
MNTNTAESFKNKWTKNTDFIFAETLREGSEILSWIINRNGFQTTEELREFLKDKKRILDAGCGNGRVTALLQKFAPADAEVVGIDLVAAEVAGANLADLPNVETFKKDLLEDLSDLGKFDFIYCQEVLHHTANPEAAFKNLTKLLSDKGEIAIYVYKQKAPVREFVDDFIRDRIADLPYEEALKVSEQITLLGKALSELNVKVQIPAVDVLDIKEGEYDVQRFIYHFFMKCFWNKDLTMQENIVTNYDWYHPQLCSRHTVEEIRGWFSGAGLEQVHEFVDFYGITIRGRKTA